MKKIVIRKLFGRFDYTIRLSDTGITILTGPNGFGKSTILRCIRAIADGDVGYFQKLDFEKIRIIAQNKKNNLTLNKDQGSLCVNGKKVPESLESDNKPDLIIEGKWDVRVLHYMKQMNARAPMFYEMRQCVGELFYISEQRLIRPAEGERWRKSGGEAPIIREEEEIPGKLKYEMSRVAERYSNVANRLDSTFPQRLFAERNGITRQEFNDKMTIMQDKVEKLKKYDISDIGELEDIQFKEEDSRALKVYFEDFEKKYQQYETLIRKLDMFTDMINARFLFKKARISKEEGLQVVDDDTGEELNLLELSSGEKETLVLFYQLLFEVPDGAMLLVDEPEISLHIAWQRMFADDLMRIVEYKHMKALIATHSPQIVNGRRDIQVDLGELYEKRLHTEK